MRDLVTLYHESANLEDEITRTQKSDMLGKDERLGRLNQEKFDLEKEILDAEKAYFKGENNGHT